MTIKDGIAIAARRRLKLNEMQHKDIARRMQSENPSDPFVYGRVMARLRSGAMSIDDYAKEHGSVST